MDVDRGDVIQGLRDLADLLHRHPTIPTPRVTATAALPPDHSFIDVLSVCEAARPFTIEESLTDTKREIVHRCGPVALRVIVDATAVGELRTVQKWVPEFFIDTELIRLANQERSDTEVTGA